MGTRTFRAAVAGLLVAAGLSVVTIESTRRVWATQPTVWVGSSSGTVSPHLTPIDTSTNTTGSTIASAEPDWTAISPDGTTAYLVQVDSGQPNGTVTPINLTNGQQGNAIAVGSEPFAAIFSLDGKKVYVSNEGGTTVSVINVATNSVTKNINVGHNPFRFAMTPDGNTLFVGTADLASVTPIDTTTDTAGAAFYGGFDVTGLAVTPDGSTLLTTNPQFGQGQPGVVYLIPIANTGNFQTVNVGHVLQDVVVTPDGATAYLNNDDGSGHTSVIPVTLATKAVGNPIPVQGSTPFGMVITPDGQTVYNLNLQDSLANPMFGIVDPIATSTNTALQPITVTGFGNSIAIAPTAPSSPTGCVTGSHAGNLTLHGSSACVDNATITGNLKVSAGTSATITNATIGGSVSAHHAGGLILCQSHVHGSVSVFKSTGVVVIGDAGDDTIACAGNFVHSNVTASGNTANAELGDNQVHGSVLFTHNTGSGGTETSPEVEANTIDGNLKCNANNPSVSNDGQVNAVGGARTGQCVGL